MAIGVAHQNGAGFRGDFLGHLIRQQRPHPIIDLGKNRRGPHQGDGMGGFPPGIRRSDNLIARTDTISPQHQHHAQGAAADRNGVFTAHILGEQGLEFLDLIPHGDPGRFQHIADRIDFGGGNVRIGQGNPGIVVAHRLPQLLATTRPVARAGSVVITQQ